MKACKIPLAVLFAVMALGRPLSYAGTTAGALPFEFASLDANARAVGMGGAYTALATDANALQYNPAGLGRLISSEATFMHNQYITDISQEYLAVAFKPGWGGNVSYLDLGRSVRTTYDHPAGMGEFDSHGVAVGIGYGRAFSQWLSLGLGVKYLREDGGDTLASAFAVDAGALLTPEAFPSLTLGLAIQNVGPEVRYQSQLEKLPVKGRAGLAWRYKNSTLALEATRSYSYEQTRLAAGLETLIAGRLALRFGLNALNGSNLQIAGGVGWLWKGLSLDYAVMPYGDLGMSHRTSVSLRFPQFGDLPAPEGTEVNRKFP